MAENIKFNYGWLKDAEGNNFAPKTTTNQVYTSTGETLTGELGAISDDVSNIKTQKGTANGLASLDSTGKVPSSQLPPSLSLGETASTAFRGDQGKIAYTHANAKGSAFANGLYKFTTNAEGHVTEATAVTKEDITALGIDGASQIQSDWEQTDNTKSDFIKNKINITNGVGNKSIVIASGEATGDYSIAGGTNDKTLVNSLVGSSLSSLASLDVAKAKGPMSLAFGVQSTALTAGTVAIGADTTAGCKGFYFWSIDFTNKVLTLSTNQKPLIGGTKSWTSAAQTELAKWAVGDTVTIVNSKKYTACSKITAIDATAGTITVDTLPFTEIQSVSVSSFDDFSVISMEHYNSGAVDLGLGAFALGLQNKAIGSFSHAEGFNNQTLGDFGHTEGRDGKAGYAAHSEGNETSALGNSSHSEGYKTVANGRHSHAEGRETTTRGEQSHAEGYLTNTIGSASHAEGSSSITLPESITVDTSVNDILSTWKTTKFNLAKGKGSHTEGLNALALGDHSHAEGRITVASGVDSHAEGNGTIASGVTSHAEGYNTVVLGNYSHAEGSITHASGNYSHAEGYNCTASGDTTHAEGRETQATAIYSHSEGYLTQAKGNCSHAEGQGTIANRNNQHVQGKFNVPDTDNYVHIVGWGNSDTDRKNIHTIDTQGNAEYTGSVKATDFLVGTTSIVTLLGDISTALANM